MDEAFELDAQTLSLSDEVEQRRYRRSGADLRH
jgi:hypothetical protein